MPRAKRVWVDDPWRADGWFNYIMTYPDEYTTWYDGCTPENVEDHPWYKWSYIYALWPMEEKNAWFYIGLSTDHPYTRKENHLKDAFEGKLDHTPLHHQLRVLGENQMELAKGRFMVSVIHHVRFRKGTPPWVKKEVLGEHEKRLINHYHGTDRLVNINLVSKENKARQLQRVSAAFKANLYTQLQETIETIKEEGARDGIRAIENIMATLFS